MNLLTVIAIFIIVAIVLFLCYLFEKHRHRNDPKILTCSTCKDEHCANRAKDTNVANCMFCNSYIPKPEYEEEFRKLREDIKRSK